ncbi:polynucleotide adenylyltransferase PcnB [Amphibiibacter pelophylacis]|uniref:Polynucleotide adenylyltransferase PcnB n=1 Tax=Amphibiibacter pelophylacis TaxID=1799477 RepID=A0ACC6P4V7_9BURK
MIRRLIQKIWARTTAPPKVRHQHHKTHVAQGSHRVDILPGQHHIDPKLVDARAVDVVKTLQHGGFEAFIVGGAVRDLLCGLTPKDFDVATNATPEQVKALFRRSMIIGRRFRIVHVMVGRGRDHEVIEVSTFRAMVADSPPPTLSSNPRQAFRQLEAREHAVDASGRVLRDNVWGTLKDDAARRDFSINALYYDPVRGVVVDFHGGYTDVRERRLRIIGDAAQRYREDPVRLVRLLRFAAKTGFEIAPDTMAPVQESLPLLADVPASRLFDEMIKLLQTGHGLASVDMLGRLGFDGVFPVLDAALSQRDPAMTEFVRAALRNTDERVRSGKPVVPSFLLAALLWGDVDSAWRKRQQRGEKPVPALHDAMDAVFDARIGGITGRGKLAADMREIWAMQPRFERRVPSVARGLVTQSRFRAAVDFLRLRGAIGQADPALADWWEAYWQADEGQRDALLHAVRDTAPRAPKPTRSRAAKAQAAQDAPGEESPAPRGAVAPDADPSGSGVDDDAPFDSGAPVKRRRRRRKPRTGEGGAAPSGPDSGA